MLRSTYGQSIERGEKITQIETGEMYLRSLVHAAVFAQGGMPMDTLLK